MIRLVALAALTLFLLPAQGSAASDTNSSPGVRLLVLDPGDFHTALIQKRMYPGVSPKVMVYAPTGPELKDYLARIENYNQRTVEPTRWNEQVHSGSNFLERLLADKAGDVVVVAGKNARKTEYINKSITSGLNVLAAKPMAINPPGFELLRRSVQQAFSRKVLLWDIMPERFEITSILQRELARSPSVFGQLEAGTDEAPGVVMESVHLFLNETAGEPLNRPAWFFDARQQGEAIPDEGAPLVDLVQWECFPDQGLNWRSEIKVQKARQWPTTITLEQFSRVTGLQAYPEYLKRYVSPGNLLTTDCNGEVSYILRGIHVKVSALWKYKGEPGSGDTRYSLLRGTRANLVVKQGAEQRFVPTLYVENHLGLPAQEFETEIRSALGKISEKYPGVDVKPAAGNLFEITVPETYRLGYDERFAQAATYFLSCLKQGKMPDWETPNLLAKYYVTTQAEQLSHQGP